MNTTKFMQLALDEAKKSGEDLPIGCVIVKNGEIIASAHNEKELMGNPTAHAEMLCIKKASKMLGTRMNECEMYVTLEPCPMCMWAIIEARVGKLFFGAYDSLYGGSTVLNLKDLANSKIEIKGGILEEECSALIKNYFTELRNKNEK
ncbi:nucleoside deaminase [bacterium]|nr:nucleoside deaminase [bacterium]